MIKMVGNTAFGVIARKQWLKNTKNYTKIRGNGNTEIS